jgi:hypothetical protein
MKILAAVFFALASAATAFAAGPPLLLQHPALSRDSIAFGFRG